jgi:hypothetical protein
MVTSLFFVIYVKKMLHVKIDINHNVTQVGSTIIE